MASSVNNWLGFSLSPQEHQDHHSIYNSDEISGTTDCYGLSTESLIPSLNLPPPFGYPAESFSRNNLQDWNSDTNYNTNGSELSILMDSNKPKLENFLGTSEHTFLDDHQHHNSSSDQHQYLFHNNTNSLHQSADVAMVETTAGGGEMNSKGNGSFGLSMIKNWLRNNSAASAPQENNGERGLPSSSQTLSLSMGSQSSHPEAGSCGGGGEISSETKANGGEVTAVKKSVETFGQRTSIYRGVTRHRWTGRYEAHLWDNSCRREGQTRKGRQVYLGGYDKEEKAARAYDLAALKYWGTTTTTNFPMTSYEKEIEDMKNMTRQEFVASIRRKSSGFSRGASIYRGVTRHHQHGRWQARIGRVAGNKDLYLGVSTQEEAAEAYDVAAIKFRGITAVTNFEINRYDVKSILESNSLPLVGATKRLKEAELHNAQKIEEGIQSYNFSQQNTWPNIAFQQAQPLSMNYPRYDSHQNMWCKQEVQDSDQALAQSYRDLHQQGSNVHNFFQSNLMNFDTSSTDQNSSSNMYNGNYMIPTNAIEGNQNQGYGENNVSTCDNPYGEMNSSYNARNLYYLSQQSSGTPLKVANVCDQTSACNNWIPTAVPALAPRNTNSMALCHGATNFTMWNDQ
nr:PREDICTED: AP2-like ethylene-responsive transcription factor BBM1 [Daucus carota subsp. sativus]